MQCYMHMYRAYQTSLVDKKLMEISEKVDITVQTDPVKVCDSYTMMDTTTTTTTTSYINIGSPAKRRALHSISSDGNTPSQNNDTIEMPLFVFHFRDATALYVTQTIPKPIRVLA
ncbi:unnamed protein product [Didymodactylos carnosus]|uniref:Uncharacterized protein n=1 Tax=Didymodactylos carnosus TaxID=1234261 RepID=A0A8S2FKI8_9BILA|nr:unnamed protein product [Didymodactylos carnosus]CAF4287195.1 unnamed protein product [Didymodactylos carnosus]